MNRGRISQAALRELNDLFSDQRGYRVGAVGQPKRVTSLRECSTHRFDQFWVERLRNGVIGKMRLKHYALIEERRFAWPLVSAEKSVTRSHSISKRSPFNLGSARRLGARNLPRADSTRGFAYSDCSACRAPFLPSRREHDLVSQSLTPDGVAHCQ